MADDELLAAGWRRAVFEGADFSVRATDSGLQHAQLDIRGGQNLRFGLIDNFDGSFSRRNGYSFHARSSLKTVNGRR